MCPKGEKIFWQFDKGEEAAQKDLRRQAMGKGLRCRGAKVGDTRFTGVFPGSDFRDLQVDGPVTLIGDFNRSDFRGTDLRHFDLRRADIEGIIIDVDQVENLCEALGLKYERRESEEYLIEQLHVRFG